MERAVISTVQANAIQPWSVLMAHSVIQRRLPFKWHYEHGLMLLALERLGERTGDRRYLEFVQESLAPFIDADGCIATYTREEYNLDQINPGKVLFSLYRRTGDERYKKALFVLRAQLRDQPRTPEGGFWHKAIYPQQMWLDGLYMAAPFYAEFGRTFGEPEDCDDAARQILLLARHTRDPRTGLYFHAWDSSKQQRWADPVTGCSPHLWGRAVGWFAMALVDTLEQLPAEHVQRGALAAILRDLAEALTRVQDMASGLWYQVLDQGTRPGNYLEASASCMFIYALARGARRGDLPERVLDAARRGYRGVLGNLVEIDERGLVNLHETCGVAGLGGNPYRDGSYDYYVGEKRVTNDYKGVGPFILASLEMENLK